MPDAEGRILPEDYEPGSREWLAACILHDVHLTRATRYGQPVPYYMLMPTHPALAVLLAEYKKARKIPSGISLGDMDRTLFELSMLSDEAIDALAENYRERESYGTQVRRAIRGEVDFAEILETL